MTPDATPATPSAGPQSVDRALELLDVIAEAPDPVSAKALARRAGCALSTVYHLLGPLTARGLVVRTSAGYALGHRIPTLHQDFQRQLHLGRDTREVLLRLRDATGAQAYFSTFRDGGIAIVDSTAAHADRPTPFVVGPESRAHATAHGKALLAALPRAVRQRYLTEHGLPPLTEHTITSRDRFEAELRRVRRGGVAVSVAESDTGYACLAVPLPTPGLPGQARALSVSLPASAYQRHHARLVQVLTRAARDVH
ncbi:IclR family transcriptional regulator [Streptomyces sp. LX-29]|uniref:IclR family transcriptional regulator n=1 Tax=Streptomyces sp. LX-29 TaxID=2900152 RepID=UPI00240E5BDB|nr:IclR family transcriptional regulator [Streptomyces sp. LX-29]